MTLTTHIPATTREFWLIRAFEPDGENESYKPCVFNPASLSPRRLHAVMCLIAEGSSPSAIRAEYVALGRGKLGSDRYLARGIQRLMGSSEHRALAERYVFTHFDEYKKISQGFLGLGSMINYAQTVSRRNLPQSDFRDLLKQDPEDKFENLCRSLSGTVLTSEELAPRLRKEADAHGFLMCAIAHKDAEAIATFLSYDCFLWRITREDTLTIVAKSIAEHPEWGLEPALGGLLERKSNEVMMTEVKFLLTQDTKKENFKAALWDGGSAMAKDLLVSYAITEQNVERVREQFLWACVEKGISLIPGIAHARHGFGAYLDMLADLTLPDEVSLKAIDNFLFYTQGGRSVRMFRPLLLEASVEDLANHPESTMLLLHRYQLTDDKSLLKLGNKALNAKVIEMEMGL